MQQAQSNPQEQQKAAKVQHWSAPLRHALQPCIDPTRCHTVKDQTVQVCGVTLTLTGHMVATRAMPACAAKPTCGC